MDWFAKLDHNACMAFEDSFGSERVIYVTGETGFGKSTVIPWYTLYLLWEKYGRPPRESQVFVVSLTESRQRVLQTLSKAKLYELTEQTL